MGEPEASKIAVLFTVQVETGEDENMILVGGTAELGKWCLHKGIFLNRVSRNSSSSVSTWRVKVQVPVNTNFQYRYAVVENCNPLNIEKLVVKRWEGFSIRRSGSTKFQSEKFVKNNDGLIHEVHLKTDRFGLSGGADEENVIDRGFLTCQTEVHLRFHSAVECPLVLFGKESPSQFNITIKQFDSETNQKSEDSWKASHIIAKKLTDFHCQEFCNLRQNGCNIRNGEYVVFTTQILDFKKLVLEVAVKSISVDGCPSLIIGQTVVVGSQLKGSVGTLVAPLTKDTIPVGHLLVDYLVVKPFKHPSVLDMEHSPAAYWNHKNTPVYIGHRGLGSSFHCARPAYLTENTIGSFTRAHEVGADYVEFDVLLTKDGVPVVHHDFDTDVFVGKNTEMIKMEVKDLTLKQLELLKPPDQDENVAVDGETTMSNSGIVPSDNALKRKLFPTLQEVFQHTPPSLHFDVELKYPVYYVNDVENREAGAIDMNKYVDTVLQTVFENAGDRNLLFSSFDPDVCTMLRLKQHRYPVVLLTCGINDIWTMYRDIRSRSVAMGASFVLSEGIIGLGMFSTPLLKDPWKVQKAREAGIQVMFTWGDENIDVNARQRLKEMGLDGIMCDRIYEANLEPPDKRQKRE